MTQNDRNLGIAWLIILTGLVATIPIMSGGCAGGWRVTAARSLNVSHALAAGARESIIAHCGPGGDKAAKKCVAEKDMVCSGFKQCHEAMKALRTFRAAVLGAQYALVVANDDSGKPKVMFALAYVSRMASHVVKILNIWGLFPTKGEQRQEVVNVPE